MRKSYLFLGARNKTSQSKNKSAYNNIRRERPTCRSVCPLHFGERHIGRSLHFQFYILNLQFKKLSAQCRELFVFAVFCFVKLELEGFFNDSGNVLNLDALLSHCVTVSDGYAAVL